MANVHKDQEGEVLLALVDQHRESHRPVATLIVQAALNASSARDRAMVVVILAELKRQQLIEQHGDAWVPTSQAIKAPTPPATRDERGSAAANAPVPSVRPQRRDTLSPRPGGAPKPVTRPGASTATPVADPAPSREPASGDVAGRKDDGEKPRMDLLFMDMPLALGEVVDVLTQGARKYAAGNWQQVPDASRCYLAATLRHELALAQGQQRDAETNCHHLAHSICCDLFRLELALRDGQGGAA
ncbi:dATP/dGTP diphosphohydrolase domain-containing protein [Halomonas borealis]|uniref:dATP/dGTP diphosphohydrolase domain-containing protein n=1 Tax=Halomonas borealis TaxID=2508710 RepID=UPI00197ACDB0|nr:dATP/dGTP diphosphohydrolase domain-containing protein [Halomonas borealis]